MGAVADKPALYHNPEIKKLKKPHRQNEWCAIYGCTPFVEATVVSNKEAMRLLASVTRFVQKTGSSKKAVVWDALTKLETYLKHLVKEAG